ncbi:MAG: signal recognition particle protein [Alphaproteobacteria bacterium]
MFSNLANKLGDIFSRLGGRAVISEKDFDEVMREIRVALIEADVALPVLRDFIEKIKAKAIGSNVIRSVSPAQQIIKIVNDGLVEMLGDEDASLKYKGIPSIILMVGLQGSGKTTTSGKIALRLTSKEKKKVLLASLDVYRPAAQEQLLQVGKSAGLDVLPIVKGEQPLDITKRALKEAKLGGYDVLILDTAGRTHIDEDMMSEALAVKKLADPAETLLVADAMTGQDAVNLAREFNEKVGVTGIVLTRIDGDARGGAALSMKAVAGCPIKFLGVSEKIDGLELFDAKRIAGRILGMGDVVSLVETAIEKVDQEEAEKLAKRMLEGRFNLQDMLSQMQQMKKMGSVKDLVGMLPGMGKFSDKLENAGLNDKAIRRQEAIILSMTFKERRNPDLIKASRKKRIADGAGVSVNDVNRLLKQYLQMANMMKKMKQGKGLFGSLGNALKFPQGLPDMSSLSDGKFPVDLLGKKF